MEDEIAQFVEELGNRRRIRRYADPLAKVEAYHQLGVHLTYEPAENMNSYTTNGDPVRHGPDAASSSGAGHHGG